MLDSLQVGKNNENTTLAIRNAGYSADLKTITLYSLS